MLKIEYIRENTDEVIQICENRGVKVDIPRLVELDIERRKLQTQVEQLQAKGNQIAKQMKRPDVEDRAALIAEGAQTKKEKIALEEKLVEVKADYNEVFASVPNSYAEDTPISIEEEGNLELTVYGDTPAHTFTPKSHMELGERFGYAPEAGAKVSGAGFPLMRGALAMLESALMRYTLDLAIERGFEPCSVPLMVRPEILIGLGFNPRRDDEGTEIFSLATDSLCMAGTAEISLVGQYADQIIDTSKLPIKHAALTPCFRREGASGRRDAGLYRNKMFNKVELVALTIPEHSEALLASILEFEVDVFRQLDLHFRVIRICSGDLGAPAFKKYDIEGWMLGRGEDEQWGWGELTSCSNCTDYQANRLKIRHRSGKEKPQPLHTLNGTGVTTRGLICILEQNQTESGDVLIPEKLRPYMQNKTWLSEI